MEFYRYWSQVQEGVLALRCTTYVSIYESPSFYWCVPKEREAMALSSMKRGTGITAAMRRHRGKRVSKHSKRSQLRKTREQALDSFAARKQAHFNHAIRSCEEARVILRALNDSRVENWSADRAPETWHIPGTQEFVREYYNFDY